MKNHEGYHDPIAGEAIRRGRHKKEYAQKRAKVAPVHLTYLLYEVDGFPDTEMILGKQTKCKKHVKKQRKQPKKNKKSVKNQ